MVAGRSNSKVLQIPRWPQKIYSLNYLQYLSLEKVYILRDRFPLDGVLVAVAGDASGIGLCKLCRVRFRLSIFGESAAEAALLDSIATVSTADILALREGTAAASNNSSFIRTYLRKVANFSH